jgi:putative hemolysin
MSFEQTLRRRARRCVGASLGTLVVGTLVGCASPAPAPTGTETTAPVVDQATAQRQMVAAVDETTAALGGAWQHETGPEYAEDCALPNGEQGAQWRFLVTRPSVGEVASDVAATEARWRDQGMSIDHWGTADEPTITGRGGGTTKSISLSVAKDLYGVEAVSLCFPGDADEL